MFNFGFVVEQALGHVTHYQNLKRWVAEDANIFPSWMPIRRGTNDIWEYMPVIRNNWSLQASLRTRDAIKTAVRMQPLDALFLHTQTLALYAIPFMRQIPTIISTDATPLNYDTIGRAYNHKVGGNSLVEHRKFLWNKSTYHSATAIVAFCQWAKDSLIVDYGVPAEKVRVIPPGVDLEQWNFRRGKIEDQISTNPLRLLFVGGDFARKGGYTLLEAFRNGLNKDCQLDIVTKDANIERELAGIENIRVHRGLTPNSQALKELYAQADIFVFPTQADCLPNAISEAMAVGLPIITTDVGALGEQVEHGVNGLIVPPSDTNALVNAVSNLKSDETKRAAMATASRRIAEERFDARRNYAAIFALMKSISKQNLSQQKARNLSRI
ncbi:glycosyltransferase family 4 protein [Nostoc sp. CENA67]|uniref:Glycosyltransferase family 4 protein n=1 Tax=Amazonocrinis nigriterrae CENA67 TaxID=2794033 RepID=A0A8J7LEN3_9NOST|nr:glycosyltransferase family 4 protein [Amazonocrinis nigriterrae]MBH8566916.1 glycosyltransferase family 4 protein [Amazonocrinis nigriterrae CENA67]